MKKSLQKRLEILKISTLRPDLRLGLVGLIFLSLCLMRNSQAYPYVVAENYYVLDDPRQSVAADFNGDGYEDIAVVNYRVSKVSVLLNSGSGTFLPAVNYDAIGEGTNSIAAADFDGDTDIDLAVTNFITDTIVILRNNGSGAFTFTAGDSYTTGVGLKGLAGIIATNLNGDLFPDLVVADNYNNTLPYGTNYISVLLNNGAGSFLPAVDYAVYNSPVQIVSADFDGDADNDLVIGFSQNYPFSVLENNGDGTFMAAINFSIPISFIVAGDFNGDGKIDLAGSYSIAGPGYSTLKIIKNDGDNDGVGPIHFTAQAPTYAVGNFSNGIVAGDFNYDSFLDLAVAGYIDNTITIFEGNGDFTFSAPNPDINTLPGPYYLMSSDFDKDNKLDLVSVNKYENVAHSSYGDSYSGNSVSVYRSGVIIRPTNGAIMVAEGGATDSYSVVLGSQPSNDVVITPVTADGQTTALPSPLTFTSLDWNTPQIVTVTAVDDVVAEGAHTAIITHTATSLDLNYNAKGMPELAVTVADNDSAGVIVNQSGGATPGYTQVREGVTADDSFSVVLETAPASDVVVTIGHSSQISLSASSLTFTNLNWATPQIVTITAPNDSMIEGTVQENIVFNASSLDLLYNGLAINSIEINILDANILKVNPLCVGRTGDFNNDGYFDSIDTFYLRQIIQNAREPNICGDLDEDGYISPGDRYLLEDYISNNQNLVNNFEIIIDQSGASSDVGEDGTADDYVMYLRQQPSVDVGVTIGLIADGQVLTDLDYVTFTRLNYYDPQTVVVSAVDDFYVEASPHLGTITHIAYSADPNYNSPAAVFMVDGVATSDVIVNITDNDIAGVTITQSAGSTDVDETLETSDTIDISLTSSPSPGSSVEIVFSTPDGQTSVFPTSITFTPDPGGNWMIPQTVTITAIDDSIYEGGAHTGKLWGTMTSLDPNYNGVGSLDINITESPPPDPMPSLSINDVSKIETNSGTTNFIFTVTLSEVSGGVTRVTYETADGTATVADNDYEAAYDLLTINQGLVSETFTVVVNGDTKVEPSETFFVNLSSPEGATIADSQGIGTIVDDDTIPGGFGVSIMAPADLTCNATLNSSLNWIFLDNSTNEIGFRLYDALSVTNDYLIQVETDTAKLCDYNAGASEYCRLINETGLNTNTEYIRKVRAYSATEESAATIPVNCFTLANKPNKINITNITTDSITIKLDPNDGNPPETIYAIRVISGTETNFVNPDGSFSPAESWHTYAEFGGANGIIVTGVNTQVNTNVNSAGVQMVLNSGQNYSFSAKAQNGDGIETEYSEENNSIPQADTSPNISAVKGVALNLAWNSSFGLFSTAWAGNNFVIDASGSLRHILGTFSWLLNIALLILLVIFSLSLHQTLSYLRHKFKYPETLKLIWAIVSKEAQFSYQDHAQQTEEGVYHQSSYNWHKQLHNLSQNTFLGSMAIVGFKLLILGVLVSGLITMNHGSLAQTAPYTQSGTTVNVGDTLSYIVEVTNNGTASASSVVISDALSSYLAYQPGTTKINLNGSDLPGGVTVSGNNLSFAIGDLGINEVAYVVFKATVNSGSEGEFIVNSAAVTGSNFLTLTSNATSNEVEPAVAINANANLNSPIPPPINTNINQPPIPPTNTNINQPLPPFNGNINQPLPPTNDNQNVNQAPIVSPIEEQWPPIAIIGQIFSSIADIFENPKVEQASQNVLTPILVAIAAINVLPVLISTLYLLPFLHLLFLEPLMLLFGKKRQKWGVVYNSLTKLPLDLALVRLYNQENNQLVQTKVTDRQGRYIMIAQEKGKYYLSVTKPGFLSPTNLLKGETQDTKYMDLYHGEVIEVTEKDAVLTANIPLDPAEKKSLAFSEVIRLYLLKNLRLIVSYAGIILALVVVLIIPTIITIGCLILHILFFLAFRRFILPPKPKSWGIVYDAKTKEPLGSSVVRIFDIKFNKLLETQVTDSKGRYSFLVSKNEYQMLAEKPGYQNKEVKPVDLVKNEDIVNLDVGLNKV